MTLRRHDGSGAGTAVVFLDLDRFKSVNDRLGHGAGDRLLVIAAERLHGTVRGLDRVGRLGGDEFLVICPGVESETQAMEIGERLASVLDDRVDVGAGEVHLKASVGVAWTAEAIDADHSLRRPTAPCTRRSAASRIARRCSSPRLPASSACSQAIEHQLPSMDGTKR